MKRESGNEIPCLESVLTRSQSSELARRYARTKLLIPDLRIASKSGGSGDLIPAFSSLEDYVLAPHSRFLELLALLPDGDDSSGDDIETDETDKEQRRKSRL